MTRMRAARIASASIMGTVRRLRRPPMNLHPQLTADRGHSLTRSGRFPGERTVSGGPDEDRGAAGTAETDSRPGKEHRGVRGMTTTVAEARARPTAAVAAPGSAARYPALDGLRGLAVIAVVMYHAGVPWMRGGFLGVSVFFTLSGFLITRLVLLEHA